MAEKPPVITPIIAKVFEHLAGVKTLEEHDSKLDDIARESDQLDSAGLAQRKAQFRKMVATAMKQKPGSTEEEAIKVVAEFIYGRFVNTIPTDGQSRHG